MHHHTDRRERERERERERGGGGGRDTHTHKLYNIYIFKNIYDIPLLYQFVEDNNICYITP